MSELLVNTIKHTGGTTGMTIDSSGRVLKSVLPAWRVQRGADLSLIHI